MSKSLEDRFLIGGRIEEPVAGRVPSLVSDAEWDAAVEAEHLGGTLVTAQERRAIEFPQPEEEPRSIDEERRSLFDELSGLDEAGFQAWLKVQVPDAAVAEKTKAELFAEAAAVAAVAGGLDDGVSDRESGGEEDEGDF